MSNKVINNIAFTGGGSGGHILPIVSLIEYDQDNNDTSKENKNYFWFGEHNSLEEKHAGELSGVRFVSIISGKLRRYWTVRSTYQNIRDQFKVIGGFFQSLWYLKKHKIGVLFCKGGYVALPVSFAARVLGIPVFLHESDMHAGLTNRLVSKVAKTCFTGFSGVFTKNNEVVVGQILSGKLLNQEKIDFLGLDNNKTTVLVMGGSQGASPIFACIPGLIEQYKDMQFIAITGTKNLERKEKLTIPGHSWTTGFISQKQLAYIYSLCDVSLTRGSMTSLAEQHLFGIKKIITPLPFTGGNHQEHNADRLVKEWSDDKVLQNENLEKGLKETLVQYVGYKKSISLNAAELFNAHKTIWSYLNN